MELAVLVDDPGHVLDDEVLRRIALADRDRRHDTVLPVLYPFQRFYQTLARNIVTAHATHCLREHLRTSKSPQVNGVRFFLRIVLLQDLLGFLDLRCRRVEVTENGGEVHTFHCVLTR